MKNRHLSKKVSFSIAAASISLAAMVSTGWGGDSRCSAPGHGQCALNQLDTDPNEKLVSTKSVQSDQSPSVVMLPEGSRKLAPTAIKCTVIVGGREIACPPGCKTVSDPGCPWNK